MAANLLDFAFATVMDIYGVVDTKTEEIPTTIEQKITAIETAIAAGEKVVPKFQESETPGTWTAGYDFKLDSLTISNITQEGPVKEARGGINAKPIIRHKKTIRLEMEDVVARLDTFEHFFGAKVNGEEFTITNNFPGALTLIGRTYVVDKATGERVWVMLKFNKFLPDGVFEMTMESEGDLGMISIAGELFADDCGEFFKVTKVDSICAAENA